MRLLCPEKWKWCELRRWYAWRRLVVAIVRRVCVALVTRRQRRRARETERERLMMMTERHVWACWCIIIVFVHKGFDHTTTTTTLCCSLLASDSIPALLADTHVSYLIISNVYDRRKNERAVSLCWLLEYILYIYICLWSQQETRWWEEEEIDDDTGSIINRRCSEGSCTSWLLGVCPSHNRMVR